METAYQLALGAHIIGGMTALVTGLFAIFAPKGKRIHIISGKVYFWSMLLTCSTSLFISIIKDNRFLLHIGIFSFYMAYAGYRSIRNKSNRPSLLDGIMLVISLANAIVMISYFSIILGVFGVLGLSLGIGDLRLFISVLRNKSIAPNKWLLRHIGSMLGSYIATTTAFIVVNVQNTDYTLISWLGPTIIGTPLIVYWSRKYDVKKKRQLLGLTILFFSTSYFSDTAQAQTYIEGGHTRHRFAQLNLGIDHRYFSGAGTVTSFADDHGVISKKELGPFTETRLHIGGTHFWGHADFYIAIPLFNSKQKGFGTGVETGALYYPFAIRHHKLRPYIGAAFMPVKYKQGEGTELYRFKWPLTAGVTFNHGNHLIQLGCGYNTKNDETYYITTEISVPVKTNPFWISLGYKFMLETTIGAERDWQSGKTKMLTDTLASLHRLNGMTVGIGPSSAFFLKKSDFIKEEMPSLDQHKIVELFMEYGLGYYWHRPDLQVNMSYRKMKSTLNAYGQSQSAQRQALTFEVFKFFCDYHGFAAFAGPALSHEVLRLNEYKKIANKPGLTFGWDIRPNRIQSWYLRTNLRYFPNLNMQINADKIFHFDQLEFNFIQLVIFPGRIF